MLLEFEWAQIPEPDPPRILATLRHSCSALAASPDGAVFAAGSFDGTVHLWQAETFTLLRSRSFHDPVSSLAFSSEGDRLLVSAETNSDIAVWNWRTDSTLSPLSGRKDGVLALAALRQSPTVASGCLDGSAALWSIAERRQVWTTPTSNGPELSALALSPDESRILVGRKDGSVQLLNAKDGSALASRVVIAGRRIYSIAWHPGQEQFLVGLDGGVVACSSSDELDLYEFASGLCCHVACSPDGRRGAVGSSFGNVLVWDLQRLEPEYYFAVADGGVDCNPVWFTPDGTGLVTGGSGTVLLWRFS